MEIGKPLREWICEPIEMPEPLREEPAPERTPEPVTPEKEPQHV